MRTKLLVLLTLFSLSAVADSDYDVVTSLIRKKEYKAARVLIEKALENPKSGPKWHYALGFVLDQQHNKKAAAVEGKPFRVQKDCCRGASVNLVFASFIMCFTM